MCRVLVFRQYTDSGLVVTTFAVCLDSRSAKETSYFYLEKRQYPNHDDQQHDF